jgi:hypothetical protein
MPRAEGLRVGAAIPCRVRTCNGWQLRSPRFSRSPSRRPLAHRSARNSSEPDPRLTSWICTWPAPSARWIRATLPWQALHSCQPGRARGPQEGRASRRRVTSSRSSVLGNSTSLNARRVTRDFLLGINSDLKRRSREHAHLDDSTVATPASAEAAPAPDWKEFSRSPRRTHVSGGGTWPPASTHSQSASGRESPRVCCLRRCWSTRVTCRERSRFSTEAWTLSLRGLIAPPSNSGETVWHRWRSRPSSHFAGYPSRASFTALRRRNRRRELSRLPARRGACRARWITHSMRRSRSKAQGSPHVLPTGTHARERSYERSACFEALGALSRRFVRPASLAAMSVMRFARLGLPRSKGPRSPRTRSIKCWRPLR